MRLDSSSSRQTVMMPVGKLDSRNGLDTDKNRADTATEDETTDNCNKKS